MRALSERLVTGALDRLSEWREDVVIQRAQHVHALIPPLLKNKGDGPYLEADDKAYCERYLRIPGAAEEFPFFDPFFQQWRPAGYAHSNISTFRKNTFTTKWHIADFVDDELIFSTDFASKFAEKSLSRGGSTRRLPAVAVATWFRLPGTREDLPATAEELCSSFRDDLGLDSESWDLIFELSAEDEEWYSSAQDAAPVSDESLLTICEERARATPAGAGSMPIEQKHFDTPGDLADALYLPKESIDDMLWILHRKKALLLAGPPGAGKSYIARAIAQHLAPVSSHYVQFHPSFGYEYFVSGYRPAQGKGAGLTYSLESGVVLRSIAAAEADYEASPESPRTHILVIDEINRANVSAVFGELLTAIEYRNEKIQLQYGYSSAEDGSVVREISVPPNLYIIATMNNADRSVGNFDAALRRRFGTYQCDPSRPPFKDVLPRYLESIDDESIWVSEWVQEINDYVRDPDFAIGPSYFFGLSSYDVDTVERVFRYEVIPYLTDRFGHELIATQPELFNAATAELRQAAWLAASESNASQVSDAPATDP